VGKDFLKLRGKREATVGNCSREGKDNADERKGTQKARIAQRPRSRLAGGISIEAVAYIEERFLTSTSRQTHWNESEKQKRRFALFEMTDGVLSA